MGEIRQLLERLLEREQPLEREQARRSDRPRNEGEFQQSYARQRKRTSKGPALKKLAFLIAQQRALDSQLTTLFLHGLMS